MNIKTHNQLTTDIETLIKKEHSKEKEDQHKCSEKIIKSLLTCIVSEISLFPEPYATEVAKQLVLMTKENKRDTRIKSKYGI